jgi:hypothetical protein
MKRGLDRVKLYLGYLDHEMKIMGILSGFAAATLALVLGKFVLGSSSPAKNVSWLVIGPSVAMLLAALFFYRQRSHLAWLYGQISLRCAAPPLSPQTLMQWLKDADSWSSWIHYRWAFAFICLGLIGYVFALIAVLDPESPRHPCVVPTLYAVYSTLTAVTLIVTGRVTVLLHRHENADEPLRPLTYFLGLGKKPDSAADPVTILVPRTVLTDIVRLSGELTDRMHALRERNTDGELTAAERAELQTLVRMAEFGQIVSSALGPQATP